MPIKNCIHHREDKLTSLQLHSAFSEFNCAIRPLQREILYVTCNKNNMEREIELLSIVYNSV